MRTQTVYRRFSACSGRNATHSDCTQVYLGHKNVPNPEASYFAEDRMIQVEVRYVCNCFCGHRFSVQGDLLALPEREAGEPEAEREVPVTRPRQSSLF